jgi:hypothetical protein
MQIIESTDSYHSKAILWKDLLMNKKKNFQLLVLIEENYSYVLNMNISGWRVIYSLLLKKNEQKKSQ